MILNTSQEAKSMLKIRLAFEEFIQYLRLRRFGFNCRKAKILAKIYTRKAWSNQK